MGDLHFYVSGVLCALTFANGCRRAHTKADPNLLALAEELSISMGDSLPVRAGATRSLSVSRRTRSASTDAGDLSGTSLPVRASLEADPADAVRFDEGRDIQIQQPGV